MKRYKVDTEFGYISFDSSEYDKALEYYEQEGIRLIEQQNVFDEGYVLRGLPIITELDYEFDRSDLN